MYVFLSSIFYRFSLTPIFKKLDAFIPALSLLGTYVPSLAFLYVLHTKNQRWYVNDTNPCVFLFIILYI